MTNKKRVLWIQQEIDTIDKMLKRRMRAAERKTWEAYKKRLVTKQFELKK